MPCGKRGEDTNASHMPADNAHTEVVRNNRAHSWIVRETDWNEAELGIAIASAMAVIAIPEILMLNQGDRAELALKCIITQ
jgi:hypothetical protein